MNHFWPYTISDLLLSLTTAVELSVAFATAWAYLSAALMDGVLPQALKPRKPR